MSDRAIIRRAVIAGTILVLGGAMIREARADRGSIRVVSDVDVAEPAQRAIIAHDGIRELLILQTEVVASADTKLVEFMPLPSKPEISAAPEGCFAALQEMVKAKQLRYVHRSFRGGREAGGEEEQEPLQVVVRTQIGAHDVTVVETESAAAFEKWATEFFRKHQLGQPALGADLRETVSDYVARGYTFFAFDVISISPEQQTVRPLAYQFATTRVYYPLKVTNLYGGGFGTVELFFVIPDYLKWHQPLDIMPKFDGATAKPGWLWSTQAYLNSDEAARLHPAMPEMLEDGYARLHAVKYQGPLYFEDDIACPVSLTGAYGDPICRRILREYGLGERGGIDGLLSVPFSFDRKRVIEDRSVLAAQVRQLLAEACDPGIDVVSVGTWRGQLCSEFEQEFIEKYARRVSYGLPQSVTLVLENGRALTFMVAHKRGEGQRIIGLSTGAP